MDDNNVSVGSKRTLGGAFYDYSEGDTLTVNLAEVPSYLQQGELFPLLKQNEITNSDEVESISVPKNCLKQNDSVENDDELVQLLHSLRYWVVEEMPEIVYGYLTKQRHYPSQQLIDIARSFPAVEVMLSLIPRPPHEHLAIAAREGDLRLMRYLRKQGHAWQGTECYAAAETGQLACLQYAHEDHCSLQDGTGFCTRCACNAAFENGHLSCLQYAHEQNCEVNQQYGWTYCERTSIACIRYVLDRHAVFDGGIFKLLLDGIGIAAVRLGSIDCVQQARSLGWEFEDMRLAYELVQAAFASKDPAMLEYVIKEGCRMDGDVADKLVDAGRTDNLLLLLDRGKRLNVASVRKLGEMTKYEIIKRFIERKACTLTAVGAAALTEVPQPSLLVYAFEKGYAASAHICTMAAAAGNLTMLQCAIEHGCGVDARACAAAAGGGCLACLQCVVQLGAKITTAAVEAAVRGGHADCLQYLHEQGSCKLTTELVPRAIDADSVSCLRYLHDRGCMLDSAAGAHHAANVGSLECLRYYNELAGPQQAGMRAWDTAWGAARRSNSSEVREYAQQQG
jgi:hypothetical protein